MPEKRIVIEEHCGRSQLGFFIKKYYGEERYNYTSDAFLVDKSPIGNPPHFVVLKYEESGLALSSRPINIDVAHSLEEAVEQAYEYALEYAKQVKEIAQQRGDTYKIIDETSRVRKNELKASAQS